MQKHGRGVVEFFLSPVFGSLSERYGRKPMVLFLMIGPAIMRVLCATVTQPVARIRLLTLGLEELSVAVGPNRFGIPFWGR